VPEVVVAARSVQDVTRAMAIAGSLRIPVTPRAQATSGYGGAIPCKGGMVLDVSGLDRVLAINAKEAIVDVEPGVVWEALSRTLAKAGLDNRVCPTSAPSSTVGGWFAMGGVGIGSLRYGSIRDNVIEIDVAGLDGRVTTYAGEQIEPFHQTCGTLGVITRLRLACRKAEAMRPASVWLPGADQVARFLAQAEAQLPVYSACLQSSGYCALRAEADGHAPAIAAGFLITLAAPEATLDEAELASLAQAHGGRVLGQAVASREWAERFYPMRIKKIGPSVLVGEFYIPLSGFAACIKAVQAALPRDVLGLEAFAVRNGSLAVLVYMLDDAGALLYPLRMGKAMIPLRLAQRHGGRVYASGMWFAAERRKLFGPDKFTAVARLKKRLDPHDLLNPGKTGGPGFPFLPFLSLSRLIVIGTAMIAPLSARLPYKRSKTF
jgi:FAD/FMN-containing dehydrogenase